MQEPLFDTAVTHRFYNLRAIVIGTFIGGPFAGAYLSASNFKMIGEHGKAIRTWVLAVVLFAIIIFMSLIPGLENIPALVYSFVFCMTAYYAAKHWQGSRLLNHLEARGTFYSTWRAVGVSVIFLLLMLGLILGFMHLAPANAYE